MRRLAVLLSAGLIAVALCAAPAHGAFGLSDFQVAFSNEDESAATQAGSHPFKVTTSFTINFSGEGTEAFVHGKVRDAIFEQVAGLVGDATTAPTCSTALFLRDTEISHTCPNEAVVGMQAPAVVRPDLYAIPGPVFNLPAPPGVAVRLGWNVRSVPIVVDLGIEQAPAYEVLKDGHDYRAFAAARGLNQTVPVFRSIVELWGVPADPRHDMVRGWNCAFNAKGDKATNNRIIRPTSAPRCETNTPELPFLTLPRSCEGPAITSYMLRSWQEPDVWVTGFDESPGMTGCEKPAALFVPTVGSRATTDSAETGTGLDFSISIDDPGLKNPKGIAQSDIERAVVTLPEGVTVNPSVGEGLAVCTPADLDRETLASEPGDGCPNASKVGAVEVESPLVPDMVKGSVFVAQQDDPTTAAPGAENPFDSLIAFYIVLKSPELGILVKQPARVEPDPRTGQLVTTVDDIPQIPFSEFRFHFREGQRAPLVSPPVCGTHTTRAELTPRADPTKVRTVLSSFEITRGVGGGPCPPGGVPPFKPGFVAGLVNNDAGSFSPFVMRLTRQDGEQSLTKFSATLPPGVVGKLAGVAKCPNAAILAARDRTGRAELAAPSCPASSRIGRTLAGAGVGSSLTHVPGSLYLAGPYRGAPLSVVSVTPALAAPFDAGVVVVRVALDLNPTTAQVEVDGSASDPIPHILKGIPLKMRDLEVVVDRSRFTLNPTSCRKLQTNALVFGSFIDLFSPADDVSVALTSRYQAANCAGLGFKPRLKLKLRGGTERGDHPALRAVLRPRPGDANIAAITVTLPRSAFLEQAHIRTICTRVQYAADACPNGSIYGRVRVFTPLLDDPLEGEVYLRSSDNELPDLVLALKGLVDIDVSSRIDSHRGGIRNTFRFVPDAPVTKAVLNLQGGRRSLIVNSRDLCAAPSRAKARLVGHNGKVRNLRPQVRAKCGGGGRRERE